MQVVKIRVKHYKSIKDSGECYLDDKITILAGRNEAGKTAILEALEDFNAGKPIKKDAIPIWNKDAAPEISLSIKLDKDEIDKIKEKFELKGLKKDVILEIIKQFPADYTIQIGRAHV